MKQGKVIGMILAVLNVILIAACAVLYFGLDRTKPQLEFQASEIVYREGMEKESLLQGVTAYDSTDGDITDRIVIEKTMENRNDGTIVVFYAVTDKSGNAAKASRVFNALYAGEDSEGDLEPVLEAGISAELNQEINLEDDNIKEPFGEAAVSGEDETPVPTEEPTSSPTATPRQTPAPTPAPEPTPRPAPTADPSAPILTLKVSEVSVNAGQGPAWVDVIGTLKDDKDDYGTLFGNLSVSKYDRDKAGTYQVTVSVEDSDGNRSQAVPLTIIVK